jgi:hypothetical protein
MMRIEIGSNFLIGNHSDFPKLIRKDRRNYSTAPIIQIKKEDIIGSLLSS